MTRRLLVGIALVGVMVTLGAYTWIDRADAKAPTSALTSTHDSGSHTADTPRGVVELDARRQQLIGVRTAVVRRAALDGTVRAPGTVVVDETTQSEISTRVDGWIRELRADFTGRAIRRGEPLFTLYSPDLIATEQEYLLALKGRSMTATDDARGHEYSERLIAAARERLLRMDVAAEDIEQLERTGIAAETIVFRSPVNGTIVEKPAVRGMRVMAGQTLFRVADLSSVWVEAEVYESDLAYVRPETRVTVAFDAYPQRTFAGRISFVSPTITPETRTARVRVTLANTGGLLKPHMLAEVSLQPHAGTALVAPPDAIVNTGSETIAFIAEGDGRFAPRRVRVGRQTSDGIEIVAGLKEGETIAASATFFLDSESQLRGALQNYEATPTTAAADAHRSALDLTFKSDPESPSPGDVTLIVTVAEAGKPLADAEVSVVLFMAAMPTMNMPAMRTDARLTSIGNGTYRGTAVVMTPGRWDVTVTVAKAGHQLGSRQFALVAR